uniref:aminotransferase class I/II-fold pyridoxal phosphate-dependent enzyme n=1 Tax=Angelakisella sp. TaxID=1935177 RepID=UPI003FEF80C3
MIDLFEKCRKPSLASELKEKGIYPYFHALESRQAPEVIMEGRRRIMLGSNNYLGLTTCPEVIEAGIKAFEQYGTGCSGSRFLNGTLEMHLELEAELAKFLHKEAVVTFSTGFQSNLGIISAIVGRGDVVICDKENHASIYDGCKLSYGKMLRFDHADMEDLERQLQKVPENAGCLIVTDGVFSMGGDIAKLPEIVRLAKQYGARVMVDDAHGLGVLGEGGRGTASHFGLEDEVDIYMGTFSKSLASLGGYMASSHEVAEYVRHASRPFIFSASITPASCATALAALRYLEAHPEIVDRLNALSAYARDGLRKKKVKIIESTTPIIPLYTYT